MKAVLIILIAINVQMKDITTNSNYNKTIDKVEELSKHDNFVKVYKGYQLFSFDNPKCGNMNCQFPLLEIFDQSLPLQKTNKFPTLLIATGFSGQKDKGNVPMELLNVIEDMIVKKESFILKNFRILVIPLGDPVSFFQKKNYEKIDSKKISVLNDFPMYFNKSKCLQTISSKIFQAIYTKYLISMSLFFDSGSNQILYPYSSNDSIQQKPFDHLVFQDISKHFVGILKKNLNQKFTHKQYKKADLEENNMLDWFYSASWNKQYHNDKCSNNNLYDGYVTQYSNRTLPFWVVIKDQYFDAIKIIIKESVNILTPNLQLLDFTMEDGANEMTLQVRGCLELDRISFVNGLDYEKIDESVDEKTQYKILVFQIYNDQFYNKNFLMEINCEKNWSQIEEDYFPQAILTRQRIDYNFAPSNDIYTLENRFNDQIQFLDFRNDANVNQVYLPMWNQIQLFYEQSLTAQFDFMGVNLTQSDNNTVKLSITFDQQKTKWKIDDFEFYISQYGDLGYYDQQAIGQLTKIDNEKLQMNDTKLQNLLGLYLVLKQQQYGFQQISLIKLQNYSNKQGYQIPQQGLTCIQRKRLDYFYLNLIPVNSKKTKLQILTNKNFINYIVINQQQGSNQYIKEKLFLQRNFKNPDLGLINVYEKNIIQNFTERQDMQYQDVISLQNQLLGGLIQIYDQDDKNIFTCRTGIKNPFYDEETNLQYSIMSYPFEAEEIEQDLFWKSIFTFLITVGAIVLFYVGYKFCKKKKPTDISKERIKIEENYF